MVKSLKNAAVGPDAGAVSERKTLLYLALTNQVVGRSPIQSAGPGFLMPPTVGYGLPAYEPLGGSSEVLAGPGGEPTAEMLAEKIEDGFERGFIRVGSMESEPITFAGMGEPLLRLDTLTEAARLAKTARHGAQLRLKTSGLVPSADSADTVARLVDAGIKSFSVALNAATPPQYSKLMAPPTGVGFGDVCNFISVAAEHGVSVECTAVAAPGVKTQQVQKLALSLGATEFRTLDYLHAEGGGE